MSKNRKISSTSASGMERRREVFGVIGLGAGLFLLIAMVSLQAHALVMGPFGRSMAGLFYGIAGVCGYLFIALGVVAAIRTLLDRDPVMPITVAAGTLLGVLSLATLLHLIAPSYRVMGYGPGGALGEHFAEILRAVISTAGTALLALIGLVVAVVIATPLRMRDVLHAIWAGLAVAGRSLRTAALAFAKFWLDVFRAILPEKGDRDDDDDVEVEEEDVLEASDDERGPEPVIIERTTPNPIDVVELTPEKKKKKKEPQKTEIDFAVPAPAPDEPGAPVVAEAAPKKRMAKGTEVPPPPPLPQPEPTDHAGPVIFEPKFKAQ